MTISDILYDNGFQTGLLQGKQAGLQEGEQIGLQRGLQESAFAIAVQRIKQDGAD